MHKNKCIKTQIKVDLKADIKQHGLYGHAVFAFLAAESPQSVRFAAFRISGYPGIMHSGFRHAGIAFRAGLHGFFVWPKPAGLFAGYQNKEGGHEKNTRLHWKILAGLYSCHCLHGCRNCAGYALSENYTEHCRRCHNRRQAAAAHKAAGWNCGSRRGPLCVRISERVCI